MTSCVHNRCYHLGMNRKLFIGLESAIYLCFIILDILNRNTIYLKYAGIVLCFIYSLYSSERVISVALFFTLVSDFFLLVINRYYVVGVSTFIIVQLLYCYYIYKKKTDVYVWLRIVLSSSAVLLLINLNQISLLNVLVVIYFTNLVMNAFSSLTNSKLRLLSLGLFLFVCCDICVGLFNILSVSSPIYPYVSLGMWIFYLPSQVLITLSTKMEL